MQEACLQCLAWQHRAPSAAGWWTGHHSEPAVHLRQPFLLPQRPLQRQVRRLCLLLTLVLPVARWRTPVAGMLLLLLHRPMLAVLVQAVLLPLHCRTLVGLRHPMLLMPCQETPVALLLAVMPRPQ